MTARIAIVDYGVGNLGSIVNMFKKVGVQAQTAADPEVLRAADRLLLPGVGAFDRAMTSLKTSGLIPVLEELVLEEGKPLLGICLGMQLLAGKSEEGTEPGLGWLDADVVRLQPPEGYKVPHMGWNEIELRRADDLFAGEREDARYYFLHSYRIRCNDPADVIAETDYGETFVSACGRGNIAAVQFHPEKSHRFGMTLFSNFAGD